MLLKLCSIFSTTFDLLLLSCHLSCGFTDHRSREWIHIPGQPTKQQAEPKSALGPTDSILTPLLWKFSIKSKSNSNTNGIIDDISSHPFHDISWQFNGTFCFWAILRGNKLGQNSNFAQRFFWTAPLRVKELIYTLVPGRDRDGEEIIFGRGNFLME